MQTEKTRDKVQGQQLADAQATFARHHDAMRALTYSMVRRRQDGRADEDTVAEAIAHAWVEWLETTARGADPVDLWPTLVKRAVADCVRGMKLVGPGKGSTRGPKPRVKSMGESAMSDIDLGGLGRRKRRAWSFTDTSALWLDWGAFVKRARPRERLILRARERGVSKEHIGRLLGRGHAFVEARLDALHDAWLAARGDA